MKRACVLAILLSGAVSAEPATEIEKTVLQAIEADKTEPLADYLDHGGDANRVIERDGSAAGYTLLHHAATFGSEKVIALLLKRGADRLKMDAFHHYPVENAIFSEETQAASLLALPDVVLDAEHLREELLIRLIASSYLVGRPGAGRDEKPRGPVYVKVNGADPTAGEMKRLKALGDYFQPYGAIETDKADDPNASQGKSSARFAEISLGPFASKEPVKWRFRISTGPSLSGGGSEGVFRLRYGYWLGETKLTWDE